ncbi:DUF1622 domain-containing protein [Aurantimicrobium minutum]|uniref:DUF1622 domain-containing protein n=1 Tax=Aurantimicrobium minutum TaxID=708131 RepID=UPI002473897A|nr:DUF1622 domain-containing protein [Aurantimicrobium minutum]MDH6422924.1 putative membrane protein [Aurantimicrobium minutum]
MDPAGFFTLAVEIFDVLGVVVICVGTLIAAVFALRKLFSGESHAALQVFRDMMGGAILLGLEVFVAGDLIKTITQTPTIDSVIVLGLIVLVRTILSFTIQIEIEGTLPWRRALLTSGASVAARAARESTGK